MLIDYLQVLYVPFLMNKAVRAAVMVIFFGWLCASISVIPHVEIGLDQELSMPRDSYVLDYFRHLKDYLSVGPPVYFVVKPGSGVDFSNTSVQNAICGGQHCFSDSLITKIYTASKQPQTSFIARPSSSWIDDYFDWSNSKGCCKYFPGNDSFCSHNTLGEGCKSCDIKFNEMLRRPIADDFKHYIPYFLQDNPSSSCAKAGHAAYGRGVSYTVNNGTATVGANSFMAYHTILKTSADYYSALSTARKLSLEIEESINSHLPDNIAVEVFPYSIFYVFYEQYLTMWKDTMFSLGISVVAIFVVTFLLMGLDLVSSAVTTITISMIVADIGGLMYWWGITLNAVSLVNLVMAVGIAVEFCSHLVHSFAVSIEETRVLRVTDALVNMGSSVFSGITLTKFGGILVLGLAKSQIFQVSLS